MLTRKPAIGETLRYHDGRTFQVVSVVGTLCWIRYPDGGIEPFIWQFKEGLNSSFSHVTPEPP